MVLKPSEQDPLTHQKIVDLAREAGLPDGVLNVVHGGREVVETMCDHPDIEGVSFVGSSDVAKIVYTRAGAAGKRVQTLGGAKNFLIVMPDADMDATLDACAGSILDRQVSAAWLEALSSALETRITRSVSESLIMPLRSA